MLMNGGVMVATELIDLDPPICDDDASCVNSNEFSSTEKLGLYRHSLVTEAKIKECCHCGCLFESPRTVGCLFTMLK